MFPEGIAKFLWMVSPSVAAIVFLYNTSGGCFWQSYHSIVKLAGVTVLWFPTSRCIQFWSKTLTKRCTSNSLLSCDKTISSLLEFIGHMFFISECFGKTLIAFDFDEKLTRFNLVYFLVNFSVSFTSYYSVYAH